MADGMYVSRTSSHPAFLVSSIPSGTSFSFYSFHSYFFHVALSSPVLPFALYAHVRIKLGFWFLLACLPIGLFSFSSLYSSLPRGTFSMSSTPALCRIGDIWGFDDAVSQNYRCRVLAFDPDLPEPVGKRGLRIWYYAIAVAARDGPDARKGERSWKTRSFTSILRRFGHENVWLNCASQCIAVRFEF